MKQIKLVQKPKSSAVEGARSVAEIASRLPQFGGARVQRVFEVDVDNIEPDPGQPRRYFDSESLADLATSLAKRQLHPVLLKRRISLDGLAGPEWRLVAGERRWRAAKIAGLARLLAMQISDDDDPEEIALIENMQRQDLQPLEEAEGIRRLMERHSYSQEAAGATVGKSRTDINRLLRLLTLHPQIKAECAALHTPKTILLELARIDNPEDQLVLWDKVKKGLTLSQTVAERQDKGRQGGGPTPERTLMPAVHRLGKAVTGFARTLDAVLNLPDAQRQLDQDDRESLLALRAQLDRLLQA
jgi:ParB family transcriptional regulator, chromosome partitioning protein